MIREENDEGIEGIERSDVGTVKVGRGHATYVIDPEAGAGAGMGAWEDGGTGERENGRYRTGCCGCGCSWS